MKNLRFLEVAILENDKRLYNSVKQQKAHALINTGYMYDGELLMKKLLSDWLRCYDVLDDDTLFDLYGACQIFCVNGRISLERNPFFSELYGELV